MVCIPRRSRVYPVAAAGPALASILALGGCANVAAPPGGPADTIPPMLIAVHPDSLAVLPRFEGRVVFEFDETISERNVQTAVTVYPLELRPEVDKGKRELRVRSRGGWVPNRIYHVRVHPVIQDLFNNPITRPITYVFSTGPQIPRNVVSGVVIDRLTGGPLAQGRVDMVLAPDTLRYATPIDSGGVFQLAWLPIGEYLAIAYEDLNNNSRADNFDRSDTASVTLGATDSLVLEFSVFHHDTVGPILTEVQPVDSVTLELVFDGYLEPDSALNRSMVSVFSLAESTGVPVDSVMHEWQYKAWRDSLAAAARAARDTLRQEEADTLPEGREAPAPSPTAVPGAQRQAVDTAQAADTALARRLPARSIYILTAQPIPPGEVRVRAQPIVNLSGLAGGGEVTFEQPPRREPAAEGPEPPGG